MKSFPTVLFLHHVAAFLPYSHAFFGRRTSQAYSDSKIKPKFTASNWNNSVRGGTHSQTLGDLDREETALDAEEDLDNESDTAPINRVVLLMDGLCAYHGGYLGSRARSIPGVAVVPVLSNYVRGYFQQLPTSGADVVPDMMPMPTSIEDVAAWKELCLSYIANTMPGMSLNDLANNDGLSWVAVYCESDSGLGDAELLREWLQTECRDTPTIFNARRHKHLQQQTVQEAGGLAVAQYQLCESVEDTVAFAKELLHIAQEQGDGRNTAPRVVVKPFRGVASEAVYLCSSVDEVVTAWNKITSTQVFGSSEQHTNVLVQEFLNGVEYAVDMVSRNGQHKVAAVWRYVKQPANGASFCYFKTELVDGNSNGMTDALMQEICSYVGVSLTALGVQWGLTHTEVIVPKLDNDSQTPPRGPMLVEVNCRQHNMDFLPLVMSCIGYNAFDMTLAAMLGDESDWNDIPDRPVLRAHGCMVHLVNYAKAGQLTHNCHLQDMVDLPSVMDCEVYEAFCTPGSWIQPTVDIRSDAGWAQLVNPDPEQLERDYEQIVGWMPSMFQTQHDASEAIT